MSALNAPAHGCGRPGPRTGPLLAATFCLAALYADLITLDLLRYHVAPHVTTVEEDAHNLRDFGDGCLEAPATSP